MRRPQYAGEEMNRARHAVRQAHSRPRPYGLVVSVFSPRSGALPWNGQFASRLCLDAFARRVIVNAGKNCIEAEPQVVPAVPGQSPGTRETGYPWWIGMADKRPWHPAKRMMNDECGMMKGGHGTKSKETLDPCLRRGDVLILTEFQQRHSGESRNPGLSPRARKRLAGLRRDGIPPFL